MRQEKPNEFKFYAGVLKGEECQCGRPKKRGRAVCTGCYYALEPHMQRALYRKIGNGFEEAYEEAVGWIAD